MACPRYGEGSTTGLRSTETTIFATPLSKYGHATPITNRQVLSFGTKVLLRGPLPDSPPAWCGKAMQRASIDSILEVLFYAACTSICSIHKHQSYLRKYSSCRMHGVMNQCHVLSTHTPQVANMWQSLHPTQLNTLLTQLNVQTPGLARWLKNQESIFIHIFQSRDGLTELPCQSTSRTKAQPFSRKHS